MMKNLYLRIPALLLSVFALLTLFLSTSVIFDLFGIREMEGRYVLFVVYANFAASLLYLIAVAGWFALQRWTTPLLIAVAGILTATLCALRIYAAGGGMYESKTYGALLVRITLSLVFAVLAFYSIRRTRIIHMRENPGL